MASTQVFHRPRPSFSPTNPPSHQWELAVVTMVILNLCFLPWAFGGMERRGQLTSLILAVIGFGLALIPTKHHPSIELADRRERRHSRWIQLARFPVFWVGALLLGYIAIQIANPAFDYQSDDHQWWLVPVEYIRWLPHGMKVPFREVGVTRALVIWTSTWLEICTVWIGVRRRRSIVALLTALSINAFTFAAFGIVQRASGTSSIYWLAGAPPYFVAAIVYKNHAAAYFGLLALLTLSLAIRLVWRAATRGDRSSPAIVLVLFCGVTGLGVVLSCSISGIIIFGTAFLVLGLVTLRRYIKTFPLRSNTWPTALTAGIFGLLIAIICVGVGYNDLRENLERKLSEGAGLYSLRTRRLATQAGWRMFTDRPVLGWGAGCFCYGFSKYQGAEPELMKWRDTRLRWENVHDDWLELLIDMGVCGALGVGYILLYWMRQVVRLRLWRYPAILPLLSGIVIILGYGFFDFPLHNPAVATTAGVLLAVCVRWGELEARKELLI